MLSSQAWTCGVLLLALALCSPVPLTGQYVVGQGLIRTASHYPSDTTTAKSAPAATVKSKPVPAATTAPTPTPTLKAAKAAASVNSIAVMATDNTTTNSTTTNSTDSADTALYSVLRITGGDVTPFNEARQTTLLYGLFELITSVDFANMSISDVNPVYSSRRRHLLTEGVRGSRRSLLATALTNQADVTVQMVASSSSAVSTVLTDMTYAVDSGNLSTQLQTDSCLAASDCWNLTLLSTNITTPGSVAAIDKAYCHDKFGHWCLDKYKHLSSAGIRGVIAGGIIGLICVAALALLLKDLRGARAMRGSEVVYDPQTPNLGGGAPGTAKAGAGGVTALTATAAGATSAGTPTSGANTPSAGYTGGLAPVGSKVRRKSGAFTSGAVTHPASLAAAGKPTGLEEMIGSPAFSRNGTPTSQTGGAHQHGL